ncbi:MAG: hypothetical protein LBC75_02980 [Fibromonadaceae bacterium]|nr:hypothetical protein [Fibromonadaceae bacterium]
MNKSISAELAANWKTVALFVLMVLTFTGCGPTRVPVQVDRPSALPTTGIKRIAVMPFEYDNYSYSDLAAYATSIAADEVRKTNKFTLVDASEIQRLQANNQSVESYVDAMFIGRITRASIEQKSETTQGYTDKKGRYYPPVTTYYSKAEVEFNYALKVARDGRLIGPVNRQGTSSRSSRDGYPSSEALLRDALISQISVIGRDVAPYKSTEIREFAEDKSNDMIKAEMKQAMEHVKTQSYKLALQSYLGIYERYTSPPAAINASIMYEAMGDPESALKLMQKVYDDTGNPTIQVRIAILNNILADKAKLAASEKEEAQGQSSVDKISVFASEEIQKFLPGDTKIWIYNSSPGNAMVEAVVDNITASFIRKGIGLVDRQNAELIKAEQELQGSGSVSDEEMVRLGNAAGAKTIAIIGITGTGAMRRLQVKVLDIERSTPLFQSDTNEKWQL